MISDGHNEHSGIIELCDSLAYRGMDRSRHHPRGGGGNVSGDPIQATNTPKDKRRSGYRMMDIELICPIDKARLRYMSDGYECSNGHRYEIVNLIPRFVEGRHYSEPFGLEWNTWPEIQLDSYTGFPISADRAKLCLGSVLWDRLSNGEMNILEAGCGAGRFTEVLLSHSSVVYSFDASLAVEANQRNCPQNDKHRIFQADILELPFAPRQFDLVFCLGVVQHTKSPEETICRLYDQVREGGALVFDHYSFRAFGITNPGRMILRFFLKRMEAKKAMMVTNKLVEIFFPLHRAAKNSKFLQLVLNKIFSPILTTYHYPELNDSLQYQWSQLDTYDGLTDYYKHSRTRNQIESILREIGAECIEVFRGSNGLVGRCHRPSI